MGKIVDEKPCALSSEAQAQAALAKLCLDEMKALKIERPGRKADTTDVELPLPEASAVQTPTLKVLNKWYAGPVMLAEVNARASI